MLKIKEIDGKKVAFMQAEIELGEVVEDKDGTFFVCNSVDTMLALHEAFIHDCNDMDGLKDLLDNYATLKLYKMLGIKRTPLKYKDGEILGLGEFMEIDFE